MKPFYTLLFVLLLVTGAAPAQKKTVVPPNPYIRVDRLVDQETGVISSLDSIALFINASFLKEEDKARAVFCWVTKNITYSADLLFTYTTDNNHSRIVKDAFENKMAVCIGFAALYDTLCKLTHLTSHIIEGSTRQSFLPAVIGHAWNAVMIGGQWHFVDPTWGSGYLQGKTFVRRRNDIYFLTPPETLIASHLPIDPIWQLSARPVNLYQFHAQSKSTVKTDWNYQDSIAVFLNSTEIAKIKSMKRRLEEFGTNSEITKNYFNYLRSKEQEYYTIKFNLAIKNDNESVSVYNDYISFKNKQFTPVRTDDEIAKIMPAISASIERSETIYNQILNQVDDANFNTVIKNNLKQLADLKYNVKSESQFVNKYLATKKNKRRDLFYTKIHTLNGIPIK